MRRPLADRFWEKVNKTSACWLWTGAVEGHGYGSIGIGRTTFYAHRISWEMANGTIAPGLCVLHRCDIPLCVRPDHLFLGTKGDNMRDMKAKGRHAYCKGEHAGRAKLSEEQVRSILREYVPRKPREDTSRGVKQGSMRWLADKYGVTPATIANILAGRLWPHITSSHARGTTGSPESSQSISAH